MGGLLSLVSLDARRPQPSRSTSHYWEQGVRQQKNRNFNVAIIKLNIERGPSRVKKLLCDR
jgi:hypothetical protein